MDDEADKIREVMSIIGRRTSERKKKSSAENATKSPMTQPGHVKSDATRQRMREAQARRKAAESGQPVEPVPVCTCGRTDGTHAGRCVEYRRARKAAS